ncbi:MAG: hypothetical protein AAFX00_09555, partial [Pseudomonadota bacterium]
MYEVEAAIDADEGDRLIVVYRPNKSGYVYDLKTRTPENFDIEEMSGTIHYDNVVDNIANISDGDAARVYQTVVQRLAAAERDVKLAVQAHERGDPESAGQAAAKVLAEVLMGAQPATVQGHNALHSLPGMIDNFEKLHQVVSQDKCITEVANANGVTGGFGVGVGSVDSTWQMVGSVLVLMADIHAAWGMRGKTSEQRHAEYGANARKRKALDLATDTGKAFTTAWGAVDAIGKVCNAAATMPTPVAPIAGSVFGFVSAGRTGRQAHKARKRKNKLKKALDAQNGQQLDPQVQDILAFATRKTMRKFRTKAVESTTGAISGTGGVVVIALMAAGANAWNPVGWGIGIAVFV